ncbi:Intradiol ring-cleavage dioxygenase [Ampelomyces quisqualis]|uniref:Intradiol ring-cleavage dioxygenase n=1 Tax=Ampelomyces quisqualis TaxID=50730 RepID=A0A6A5R544_AMPQU|nr:Intradiol ring-cleavage dioxygenase [Ampelomyces quisqualis]
MKFAIVLGAILLGQQTVAHPGQSVKENAKEVAKRRAYLANNRRSLAHCTNTLKPYLRVRDLDTVLATSHKSNLTGITFDSDPSILFSGNNSNSCILTPEVTQGPYWVQGELIREDVTESGEGVPLTLHIQIIDVNTCEPVPQAFLEIWNCNSTGVYSGVVANGNGNINDSTNLDKTFLRGIQQSDDEGVVTFETLFPGHYTGRAVRLPGLNATVNANETISGGSITHVGQMFFDQDLITLVETQGPYNSNTQVLTKNSDDKILAQEAGTVDPVVEYVLLGDNVSQGVFGWLSFGKEIKNLYNITAAVFWTENGGVENENAGGAGGQKD